MATQADLDQYGIKLYRSGGRTFINDPGHNLEGGYNLRGGVSEILGANPSQLSGYSVLDLPDLNQETLSNAGIKDAYTSKGNYGSDYIDKLVETYRTNYANSAAVTKGNQMSASAPPLRDASAADMAAADARRNALPVTPTVQGAGAGTAYTPGLVYDAGKFQNVNGVLQPVSPTTPSAYSAPAQTTPSWQNAPVMDLSNMIGPQALAAIRAAGGMVRSGNKILTEQGGNITSTDIDSLNARGFAGTPTQSALEGSDAQRNQIAATAADAFRKAGVSGLNQQDLTRIQQVGNVDSYINQLRQSNPERFQQSGFEQYVAQERAKGLDIETIKQNYAKQQMATMPNQGAAPTGTPTAPQLSGGNTLQDVLKAPIPQFNAQWGAETGNRAQWYLDHSTAIYKSYNELLGRNPTTAEVQWWATHDPSIDSIRKQMMASEEYKKRTVAPTAGGIPTTPSTAQAPTQGGLPTTPTVAGQAPFGSEQAVINNMQMSPDEIATQKQLDALIASKEMGLRSIEEQPIEMGFITGQSAAVERRATTQIIPLQQKLALEQARRVAALEASKFALDRSDRAAEISREQNKPLDIETTIKYGMPAGTTMNDLVSGRVTPKTSSTGKKVVSTQVDASGNVILIVQNPDGTFTKESMGNIGKGFKPSTGGSDFAEKLSGLMSLF